jgi:superfamily II DNA or RNA helicase
VLQLRVDSRVRVPLEGLSEEVEGFLRAKFSHKNPTFAKAKAMGFYPKKGEKPIIETWRKENGYLTFPRGGFRKVREILKSYGLPFVWEDARCYGAPRNEPPRHVLTPYDYQLRCILAAYSTENCLIRSPTGSGKSTMILALAARVEVPSLVLMHTNGLKSQWIQRALSEMGIEKKDVGKIGAGKAKLRPITISTAQSLRYAPPEVWEQVNAYFGLIAFDEVHLFAAPTMFEVADRSTARYRIGISADERRKDRKHFLIYDQFGDVASEVTKEELVNREFIHDVEVVMVPSEFDADWFLVAEAVHSFRMSNPEAKFEDVVMLVREKFPEFPLDQLPPKGPPDQSRLVTEMTQDPKRNELIVDLIGSRVQKGHRVLGYTDRTDHCFFMRERLRGLGVRIDVLLGQEHQTPREFDRVVADMRSGELSAAVGVWQSMGTGLDIPQVDRGVFMTPVGSSQKCNQMNGRLCRTSPKTGKRGAKAYAIFDPKVHEDQPVRNMKAWNPICKVMGPDGGIVSARDYLRR